MTAIKAKRKLVVAVTGLNAIDSPGPGVAVIRAIRDSGEYDVRIIGLSYESLEPGIYMKNIVDRSYLIPYPSAGTDVLLARLLHINNKEKIDVLIPNFDAELYNFILLSPALLKEGIHTFLPSREQFESRDKLNLSKFCQSNKFMTPDDSVLYRAGDIREVADKLGFPLVVKGKFYDAVICNSLEQAEKAFYRIQAKWGLPVIAQEYISGTELNVAVLGDGTGVAVSIVPMRKLFITDKGKAWAGVTIEDKSLIDLAERFVKATRWKSGCELEIMMTPDGEPYIMEVNPRFPAWIYLTAASGQNQPSALVKLALGQKVAPMNGYEVGKLFVRYSWDLITTISEFHEISGRGEF